MLLAMDVPPLFDTFIAEAPFTMWFCIFAIMKSFPLIETGGMGILPSFNITIEFWGASFSCGFEGVDKLEDAEVVDVEEEETELDA